MYNNRWKIILIHENRVQMPSKIKQTKFDYCKKSFYNLLKNREILLLHNDPLSLH